MHSGTGRGKEGCTGKESDLPWRHDSRAVERAGHCSDSTACRRCRAAAATGQTDMSSEKWKDLDKNVCLHILPLVSLPRRRAMVQDWGLC